MKKKQTAPTHALGINAVKSKRKLTSFQVYKSQLPVHVRGGHFQEVPNNYGDLTWKILVFRKTGC